jgi:glycosyltransferase involved in cell wall biosynthesis
MDITIVTPSFNQAPFLATTIESVLSQAGDFSLDYIVMDGESNDGSLEIIRRFDQQVADGEYPIRCREVRMRWFSERDRGQSHAVNKGFALAKGKILGWLNSDDTFSDERTLDRVHRFFQKRPESSFVYGRGHRIDENGRRQGEEEYITAFGIDDLLEVDYILQPAAFWTRELFKAAGPLDESMHYAFDWDFWIRCSRFAKLEFMNEFLANNRVYGATKTNCGGIPRKAEIARLLLTYGGFTQRSINAYLVDRPPRPQSNGAVRPNGAFVGLRASAWSVVLSQYLRPLVRKLLTPTRNLERAIRRRLRGVPEPAAASATIPAPHFRIAPRSDRTAA